MSRSAKRSRKKYPSESATSWYILGLALLCMVLFPFAMLAGMIRKVFTPKGEK